MTREAVATGYEQFVGDAIDQTVEEFSLSRAFQTGVSTPGSSVVDKLLNNSRRVRRKVVQPELQRYRERAFNQFDIILAYAESDEAIDAYREDIVAAGAFENELRDDLPDERREEVIRYMLDRYDRFAEALVPLIESSETEFWDAATAELTVDEAHALVEEHFRYTKPLREYPDAFRMSVKVKPSDVLGPFAALMASIRVEYTDEAIRAASAAEEQIIEETKATIDRRFDA